MTATNRNLAPHRARLDRREPQIGGQIQISSKPGGGRSLAVSTPCVHNLGVMLLREGLLSPDDLVLALSLQRRHRGRLCDILLSRRLIGEKQLYEAQARHWNVCVIDPMSKPADSTLIDGLGAATCLREGLIPWQRIGQVMVVATAYPEDFSKHYNQLTKAFGPVIMALAPAAQIQAAVMKARAGLLNHAAENRVPAAESCRDWGRNGLGVKVALCLALLGLGLWISPGAVALMFTFWATLTLAISTALRIAAVMAALQRKATPPPPHPSSRVFRSFRSWSPCSKRVILPHV